MKFNQFVRSALIVGLELSIRVSSHGRLLEPPNRSSIWRCKEFSHLQPPKNWNDNELFCGGRDHQIGVNDGKCGVCGDPYDAPIPRANEDGGELYKGIIVRAYKSGDVIPVEIQLTTSHWGYFQFRLCAKDDQASHLDQACFDEHLLELADGSGTNFPIPVNSEEFYAEYNLTLPKGITCKHCVLQWHYNTGNHWGICEDGTGANGCGPQENFRACSDIMIMPQDTEFIERNPNSKFESGEEDEMSWEYDRNALRRCNSTEIAWSEL